MFRSSLLELAFCELHDQNQVINHFLAFCIRVLCMEKMVKNEEELEQQ